MLLARPPLMYALAARRSAAKAAELLLLAPARDGARAWRSSSLRAGSATTYDWQRWPPRRRSRGALGASSRRGVRGCRDQLARLGDLRTFWYALPARRSSLGASLGSSSGSCSTTRPRGEWASVSDWACRGGRLTLVAGCSEPFLLRRSSASRRAERGRGGGQRRPARRASVSRLERAITVKLFAGLRERAGESERDVELDAGAASATSGTARARRRARGAPLRGQQGVRRPDRRSPTATRSRSSRRSPAATSG